MYQSDSNILAGLRMCRSLMEMGDTLAMRLSKKGNKCENILVPIMGGGGRERNYEKRCTQLSCRWVV